jgi:hypothetical protein
MNNNFSSESNLRDMITIAPDERAINDDRDFLNNDNDSDDGAALASAGMGTDEDYGGGHMYPDDGDYDSSSDF